MPEDLSTNEFWGFLAADELNAYIDSVSDEMPFLVNHLLTENAVFMLCGDGQAGKSTITRCALAAMTTGAPVFGHFECARPLNVLYILGEGDQRETAIHLRKIRKAFPFDQDRLAITDRFAGTVNVQDEKQVNGMIQTLERFCEARWHRRPDVINIDPAYPFVPGGLGDERGSMSMARFAIRLRKTFECALWFNHHATRTQITTRGEETRRKNPYYGHVWLYNVLTAQYFVDRGEAYTSVEKHKDRFSCLWGPCINLQFDHETETFILHRDQSTRTAEILSFLTNCRADSRPFTYADLSQTIGLNIKTCRNLLERRLPSVRLKNIALPGSPGVYLVEAL